MMKSKTILCGFSIAVALQLGVLAGSAQTNLYLFSGSETNITLNPGTYIITAYGAPGGIGGTYARYGAEMSAEFNFSTSTTLTLLVGGGGSYGAGGGGGSFVVNGSTPLVIAGGGGGGGLAGSGGNGNVSTHGGSGDGSPGGIDGGGGGSSNGYDGGGGGGFLGNGGGTGVADGGSSFENGGNGGNSAYGYGGFGGGGGGGYYSGGGGGGYSGGGGGDGDVSGGGGGSIIGSSAIAILNEVSGVASPDDPLSGEVIIISVPTPIRIITTGAAFGFTNGVFGFDVSGPSGSNVVIQASRDLHTWIPLQTNLLGGGPLYFSDAQFPANIQRFYRVSLQR